MMILLAYLLTVNALSFVLMMIDKQNARKGRWRIPEAVLLGFAAAFGSCGIWMGMNFFRHKTRHRNFFLGVPVLFFIELAILVLLIVSV